MVHHDAYGNTSRQSPVKKLRPTPVTPPKQIMRAYGKVKAEPQVSAYIDDEAEEASNDEDEGNDEDDEDAEYRAFIHDGDDVEDPEDPEEVTLEQFATE